MSDRTNDEKLRILQERLAQIKQKSETPVPPRFQSEEVIEIPIKERESLNLAWVKKILIVGSVAFGIFYGYNNIDFNLLAPNFSEDQTEEELEPTRLEYKFNLEGRNIAIISTSSITDEGSAKAMVNDLKIKGFKCDYIYLPENSNLDEVYQVFIGPYENEKETNQWAKNLETEFNIITL